METSKLQKLPIFSTHIVAQFSLKYSVLGFRTLNILHLSIQVKYSILCIHKCECIYADFVLFLHYPSWANGLTFKWVQRIKNEVEMSRQRDGFNLHISFYSEWETHQNIEEKKFLREKGFDGSDDPPPHRQPPGYHATHLKRVGVPWTLMMMMTIESAVSAFQLLSVNPFESPTSSAFWLCTCSRHRSSVSFDVVGTCALCESLQHYWSVGRKT